MPLKQVGALAGHIIATDLLRSKKEERRQKTGQDRIVKMRNKSRILENVSTLVRECIS